MNGKIKLGTVIFVIFGGYPLCSIFMGGEFWMTSTGKIIQNAWFTHCMVNWFPGKIYDSFTVRVVE